MEFNFKRSYSYLTAHTFPGLLLGLETILAFKLFTPHDGFKFIYDMDYKSISAVNLIPILIILYVMSTLLGLIVDAIHHYIFRNFEEKLETEKIYKYIKTNAQLNIFTKIDDDNWYYSETCINIALSIVPGLILIPIYLIKYKYYFCNNLYNDIVIYNNYIIFRSKIYFINCPKRN